MHENLKKIKAGLTSIEAIAERQEKLEAERADLAAKVESLTATAATGDAKAATSLVVAQSRLQVLPNDLQRVQAERVAAVAFLRSGLFELGPLVAQTYGAKFRATADEVDSFLEKHLERGHERDELRRVITNGSLPVKRLESLSAIFQSNALINSMSDAAVINRCRQAVEALADVL